MTRGDLSAALSANAQALLVDAMQISRESYHCLSEVSITDDALAAGPVGVLSTLLHEASHTVCERREIKGTSRQGRYHNARFKVVGEELGLQGEQRDPLFGWSLVTATPATAALYSKSVAQLATAFAWEPRHRSAAAERSRGRRLPAGAVLGCGCGKRQRAAGRALRPRAVICGSCRTHLEPDAVRAG
ncbi:MAG: hypothetical protein ACRDPM_18250 [Solirubrobacteraceae bacterium]